MRTATHREVKPSPWRTWIPLVGLTATVLIGSTLGLWMVVSAVTAPSTSQPAAAASHEDIHPDAHEHGTGVVAMPGLEPLPDNPSTPALDPVESADRPLAATVAGFGTVNAVVLIAALLVGRSRRRPTRTAGSRS